MKPENLALVLTWHLLQRELDTRLDARVCTFYTYGTPRNGIPMSSLIKLNCTREIWRGNLSPLERTEILQPAVILVTITPSSPPSVTVLLYLIVSLAKTDFFLNLLMSRVSRFIFSNNQFSSKFSIPFLPEKNHPHRDTSVHFAASIFSPRDRDQPPPFSSEIHEKRGRTRSEEGRGERWKKLEREREEEEKKKRW